MSRERPSSPEQHTRTVEKVGSISEIAPALKCGVRGILCPALPPVDCSALLKLWNIKDRLRLDELHGICTDTPSHIRDAILTIREIKNKFKSLVYSEDELKCLIAAYDFLCTDIQEILLSLPGYRISHAELRLSPFYAPRDWHTDGDSETLGIIRVIRTYHGDATQYAKNFDGDDMISVDGPGIGVHMLNPGGAIHRAPGKKPNEQRVVLVVALKQL